MRSDMSDVIDVVERINNELEDHLVSCGLEGHGDIVGSTYLTFVYSQWSHGVKFRGTMLWDSENDDREYIDDTDEQVSLRFHLIQAMQKIDRCSHHVVDKLR